ncbi:MAG: DUF4012 domain-containing protein [Actinomycetota bacterium]|nr:DUF4012 domain-containing protein [Actinomycetota bacterium]
MIVGLLAFLLVVALLLAYVMLPVVGKLSSARDLLSQPASELTDEEGERVSALLGDVHDRVTGVPARLIGWIPIVSANLDAIEVVSGKVPEVVERALALRRAADELAAQGVLERGRVDLSAVEGLTPEVAGERAALSELRSSLEETRGGALAPPVWTAVDDLVYEVSEVERDVRGLEDLLGLTGDLLGAGGKRTYLILLMNNAELRGAGGILTGIGEMSAHNGRLRISGFKSIHRLRTERSHEVPVPEDFERFEIYGANDTSLFLNATYSPDVPDVALVASRLYEKITGTKTHGALAVDPRGIAALMPPGAQVQVLGEDDVVSTERLADFIYSEAYEEFTDQDARRDAILEVGERAFELILDNGLDDQDDLERATGAVAGGHIRVVAFDEEERRALDAVRATGDVEPAPGDSLMVAVQNRGVAKGIGSKMDFWQRRDIGHGCQLGSEETLECVTSVTLENEAPKGLPTYVTGDAKPYGRMHSFVEIFVPGNAEITALERDGEEPRAVIEEQADRVSVGLSVVIDRGEKTQIRVGYELPSEDAYSLLATPQPLAKDAEIDIALGLPRNWTIRGPGRWEDNTFRFRGTFDGTISIDAAPSQLTGLPALWESLKEFWNEPLF